MIDNYWKQVYGQQNEDIWLKEGKEEREEMEVKYGGDGYELMRQVYERGERGWLDGLIEMRALRLIWI